jgi:hypothetical protein
MFFILALFFSIQTNILEIPKSYLYPVSKEYIYKGQSITLTYFDYIIKQKEARINTIHWKYK